MAGIFANKEKILKTAAWVSLAGLIAGIAAILYSGRMFVLWYNSVLWACLALVVGVIGFWIYAAIKGIDNVLVQEKRKTDDLVEMIEELQASE